MSEQKVPPVYFSNANFAGTLYGFMSPEQIGMFSRNAGFDGVEYHPFFPKYYGAEHVANAVMNGSLELGALHQSVRAADPDEAETNHFKQDWSRADRVLNSKLGGLLLPGMLQSAAFLGEVQSTVGQHVPVTLFPQAVAIRDAEAIKVSDSYLRLFQPTDHVSRLLGTRGARSTLAELQDRGYDGYCLDTLHVRRHYGGEAGAYSDLPNTLHHIARNTYGFQLSVGRTDFAKQEPHIPTNQELHELLAGNVTGELREIIDTAKQHRTNLQFISLEIPVGAIKRAAKVRRLGDVQAAYAQLADTARQLFA